MSSSSAAETALGTRQGRHERRHYGAALPPVQSAPASPSSAGSVVRNTAGLKLVWSMILLNHRSLKEAKQR